MFDASGLGTQCITLYKKKDLDEILANMDMETLVLTKDVTVDYELLDKGKKLMLVGEKSVEDVEELGQELEKNPATGEGKFPKPLQMAFCNFQAANSASTELAETLDEQKAKKEAKDGEEEAPDPGREFLKRAMPPPEVVAEMNKERVVPGISPHIELVRGEEVRSIMRYSKGDPDHLGFWKVYIEEAEVVDCEESQIEVAFEKTSCRVRVSADAGIYVLVLEPLDVPLHVAECGWKLVKGRRLTLTLRNESWRTKPKEKEFTDFEVKYPKVEASAAVPVFGTILFFAVGVGLHFLIQHFKQPEE